MKRLTERDEFGNADIIALSDMMPEIYAELSFGETNALTNALNRLAAYEDTGLTPEEITALIVPNAPLTVEELLELDGEPVYCMSLKNPDDSGYGIVCMRDKMPYIRTNIQKGRQSNFFYLNFLGSDWIAYRRKPEEDAHEMD